MWIQLLFITQIVMMKLASAADEKIVCYYGTWAVYRPGNGKFDVDDIDPYLCTHLVYTFMGLSPDGRIVLLDPWNDVDKRALKRFNELKQINPELKTLAAIGGWNEGSVVYSDVAADPHLRSVFIQDSIEFIQEYGFDGFDLDWEYPARRGGHASDKENFSIWIKELRQAYDKYGFLLTAAVSATSTTVDVSYDVPALSRYLDFISVMAYDLHGEWDGKTGQNAPLYPASIDETPEEKELNVDACIRGWLSKGAPPEKIILGVGTYGRSFTLSGKDHSLGAPTSGPGAAGPYTRQSGVLGYNEIVEGIKKKEWTIVWNDEQKVPYAYKSNQWIGYDNPESLKLKVEFAKKLKLGGIMIWSVETDDFKGVSGSRNPLLNTIRTSLGFEPPVTQRPPVTQKPPSTFKCSKSGYFRDPDDCTKFYYCLAHKGEFLQYPYECPDGLVFCEKKKVCDYEEQCPC